MAEMLPEKPFRAIFHTDYMDILQPHDVYLHKQAHKVVIVVLRADGISTITPPAIDARSAYQEVGFHPFAITCLKETLFVTDRKKVTVFDKDLNKLPEREFSHELLKSPTGIDAYEEYLFVVNGKDKDSNTSIFIFQSDGRLHRIVAEGTFLDPWSLKINSEGTIFVSDTGKKQLLYSTKGSYTFIHSTGILQENGQTMQCRGMSIDEYDNIFVALRVEGVRRQFECIKMYTKDLRVSYNICKDLPLSGPTAGYFSSLKEIYSVKEDFQKKVLGLPAKKFDFIRGVHCSVFYGKKVLFVADAGNECIRMLTLKKRINDE
ncbi:putative RING finger protein nhl-1-like [Apostichopus japonicus]|uniref:Putative RING finger protein nhl-1-like n=1 Tax=Stichopus japonicus TaxID=307972 RepID=A0A2G8LBL6_STIJA|nr:putative RING finger protein nhl-1-like [Apostichopus japonicus]